jgi:hypothetical protein
MEFGNTQTNRHELYSPTNVFNMYVFHTMNTRKIVISKI